MGAAVERGGERRAVPQAGSIETATSPGASASARACGLYAPVSTRPATPSRSAQARALSSVRPHTTTRAALPASRASPLPVDRPVPIQCTAAPAGAAGTRGRPAPEPGISVI